MWIFVNRVIDLLVNMIILYFVMWYKWWWVINEFRNNVYNFFFKINYIIKYEKCKILKILVVKIMIFIKELL